MNRNARLSFPALSIAIAVAGTGCMNASSLQSPRTLEPGEERATLGAGFTAVDEGDIIAPGFLEFSYRAGLIENLDVGLKLTLLGSTSVDAKYQLLDLDGLALSAGLSFGGYQVSVTSNGPEGEEIVSETNVVDVAVPVLVGYDVADWFTVYAVPKYVMRSSFGTDQDTAFNHFYGATVGVKLGDTWGLFAEGTALAASEGDGALQGNLSFFYAPNFF